MKLTPCAGEPLMSAYPSGESRPSLIVRDRHLHREPPAEVGHGKRPSALRAPTLRALRRGHAQATRAFGSLVLRHRFRPGGVLRVSGTPVETAGSDFGGTNNPISEPRPATRARQLASVQILPAMRWHPASATAPA